jgi:hypothetical protein
VAVGTLAAVASSGIFANAEEAHVPSLSEVVQAAQTQAPDVQQVALADGVVSWDEHEAAIARTAQCARDAGVDVEMHEAVGRAPSRIGFVATSLEAGEASRARLDACRAVHLAAIDRVWLRAALPDDPERAANAYLSGCLAERGFDIPGETPEGAVINVFSAARQDGGAAFSAALECIEQRRIEEGY